MATKRTYHTIPYHTMPNYATNHTILKLKTWPDILAARRARNMHVYHTTDTDTVYGYGAPGINCSPYLQIVNCLSDAFDS